MNLVKLVPVKALLIALFACGSAIHAQPTGNVLSRVYEIRFGGGTATAFLLDYEDRQYFVTAGHVVESAGERASVEMMGPGTKAWKSYPVTVLHGKNKCADVAVLIPADKKLTAAEAIPFPYNFAIGQEAYFLGFPYGLYSTFSANEGMAVALVKHAYISAVVSCAVLFPEGPKDEEVLLLDGLNNPGFSGGPVVAPDMFSPFTTIRALKLVGVISGFQSENSHLQVDGKNQLNSVIQTNTGIIRVVPIDRAVDLIKAYNEKQKKP